MIADTRINEKDSLKFFSFPPFQWPTEIDRDARFEQYIILFGFKPPS